MRKFSKRLLSFCGSLMMLSALTAGLPAFADNEPAADSAAEENVVTDDSTFIVDGIGYRILDSGKEAAVSRIDETLTEANVPKEANGYRIVRIDEGAFSQCTELKRVTIPDSVTEIAAGAFYYCFALESLEIPDSVTEIGTHAFANCYALHEIKLPPHLKAIPEFAFYYDIGLEEVTIPDGVQSIGAQSFVYCYSLRKLHIPASVTEIADYAIVSCMGLDSFDLDPANQAYTVDGSGVLLTADGTRLIAYPAGKQDESFTVPEHVTSVAPYAVSGAVKLKQVILPEDVTELGDGAFSDCQSLTEINSPKALKEIPSCLFAGCFALTAFRIPDGVTSIAESAFYGCEALTEMIIPETVTEIRSWAFCGCNSLQGMRIPDSVTEIGDYAVGFTVSNSGDDAAAAPEILSGFLLEGGSDSAAKTYAEANGIAFKATGLNPTVLTGIIIGVLALMFVTALVLLRKRGKKKAAENAAENTAEPESVNDPNYSGILEDDDEDDPYDRSYGIQTDDDAESLQETAESLPERFPEEAE